MTKFISNAKRVDSQPACPTNYDHAQVRDKEHYVFFDADGVWVHVSPGMSELLGYPVKEMVGSTVDKFRPPDAPRHPVMLDKFNREGYMETMYVVRHRKGHLVHFRVTCTKLPDGCMLALWYPFEKPK